MRLFPPSDENVVVTVVANLPWSCICFVAKEAIYWRCTAGSTQHSKINPSPPSPPSCSIIAQISTALLFRSSSWLQMFVESGSYRLISSIVPERWPTPDLVVVNHLSQLFCVSNLCGLCSGWEHGTPHRHSLDVLHRGERVASSPTWWPLIRLVHTIAEALSCRL